MSQAKKIWSKAPWMTELSSTIKASNVKILEGSFGGYAYYKPFKGFFIEKSILDNKYPIEDFAITMLHEGGHRFQFMFHPIDYIINTITNPDAFTNAIEARYWYEYNPAAKGVIYDIRGAMQFNAAGCAQFENYFLIRYDPTAEPIHDPGYPIRF